MEYQYAGLWTYYRDTESEDEAVEMSRGLWRKPGVTGVRVLRTQTTVFKQAVR